MPQPGTLPRWAETLSGTQASNVVGPAAGKQDTGYATGGDIPTSGGLNWLFLWIYKWCQYVAGLTGEALTWTARQTFSGGATVVDPPVNATDAASMGYVDAEATARAAAVTGEASARAAADTAEATTRAAADTAEATARANADALLMPKAGGTFTGPVAAPSLNAPAGGALAIGATDDHATTLNRNGTVALSLDSDAQGADLFGLALGDTTHIRNVRTPQYADWAANKGYVDARFVLAAQLTGSATGIVVKTQVGRVAIDEQGSYRGGLGLYYVWIPGMTEGGIVLATASYGYYWCCANPAVGSIQVNMFDTGGSPVDSSFSIYVAKL